MALREVSSKQLAVRSKAVVGCLPASCPLSYSPCSVLSTRYSVLPKGALRLRICVNRRESAVKTLCGLGSANG